MGKANAEIGPSASHDGRDEAAHLERIVRNSRHL